MGGRADENPCAPGNRATIANSAYSSSDFIADLEGRGCTAVIDTNPTHRPREIDRHLYRERFLVEQFFQRIKRLRRISMRFEKLAKNFTAFLYLAAMLVWIRWSDGRQEQRPARP